MSGVEAGPTPKDEFWYFDSILFEIAPVSSQTLPDKKALEIFRGRLHENRICRKNRVRFVIHKPIVGAWGAPGMLWSPSTILQFEARNRVLRDLKPQDRNLAVFVSYLSGPCIISGGLRYLGGLQYGDTAFVIFKNGAYKREASVMLHEFGHLIGMVKNKDRDNHDDAHQWHCANKRCAMFWSAPGPNSDFDYYCKRYIQKCIRERYKNPVVEMRPWF